MLNNRLYNRKQQLQQQRYYRINISLPSIMIIIITITILVNIKIAVLSQSDIDIENNSPPLSSSSSLSQPPTSNNASFVIPPRLKQCCEKGSIDNRTGECRNPMISSLMFKFDCVNDTSKEFDKYHHCDFCDQKLSQFFVGMILLTSILLVVLLLFVLKIHYDHSISLSSSLSSSSSLGSPSAPEPSTFLIGNNNNEESHLLNHGYGARYGNTRKYNTIPHSYSSTTSTNSFSPSLYYQSLSSPGSNHYIIKSLQHDYNPNTKQ